VNASLKIEFHILHFSKPLTENSHQYPKFQWTFTENSTNPSRSHGHCIGSFTGNWTTCRCHRQL